jgi:glycosyltransferase involved in cell wall biosynthesis
MHIFINALAASAGGGLTYVRNVVPHFAGSGVQTTFLLNANLRRKLGPWKNVSFVDGLETSSVLRRFHYEQRVVPRLIRERGAEVLLSTGNFALRKSPVPQILLSRNALYTSSDFRRDLRERDEYKALVDTRIRGMFARKSIGWADITVAPSEAFAEELRQWTGKKVLAIHHGFDREAFFRNQTPLQDDAATRLKQTSGAIRLLFVSHYNYYRNFETLFRGLPILRKKLGSRPIRLLLTCRLRSESNPGQYLAEGAAQLIRQLGVENEIVELGTVPYEALPNVYSACDVYVTAAYAESFAHPLVEAMASGLPVVASELAVHREVCANTALYFPRFSAEDLAERVLEVVNSPDQRRAMSARGLEESQRFSWSRHVKELLSLAESIV